METQQTFFDFAAKVGITKHIGSLEATQALIELCHIGGGKYVLDVGCGVGVTPCSIARRYERMRSRPRTLTSISDTGYTLGESRWC